MILRIMVVDDDSGTLLESWVTDEDIADVRRALEEGTRHGISVFSNRAEYDKAQEE